MILYNFCYSPIFLSKLFIFITKANSIILNELNIIIKKLKHKYMRKLK